MRGDMITVGLLVSMVGVFVIGVNVSAGPPGLFPPTEPFLIDLAPEVRWGIQIAFWSLVTVGGIIMIAMGIEAPPRRNRGPG